MDYRRQSRVYIAGMRKGLEAGRSGKRKAGYSAKVSGNTEAQEFVASSPDLTGRGHIEAARLPGQRGGDTLAGMGIRLVWSNPHMTKATGRKSRAALVICE